MRASIAQATKQDSGNAFTFGAASKPQGAGVEMRSQRRSILMPGGDLLSGIGKLGDKNTKNSMARASVAYKLEDGTEAGDLIIENDRLKSTIEILN